MRRDLSHRYRTRRVYGLTKTGVHFMNNVQKICLADRKCRVSVQRRFLFSAAVLFLLSFVPLAAGCGKAGTRGTGTLQVFHPDDVTVVPEIPFYPLDTARGYGFIHELVGMLPGASEGTWYTAAIDGVEYYYGTYHDSVQSDPLLYGYAIFDESYSLTNGIRVGMAEDDVISDYPDMAVMDFDGNFLQDEIGNAGWNPAAYPRSTLDMDVSFDYGGTDYRWSDQFDHLMIAEIDQGSDDKLPLYLALLIKDQKVAAITFYHPTAD